MLIGFNIILNILELNLKKKDFFVIHKNIILFIDEAHTMIGAGGQGGQNDAANLLKPALARCSPFPATAQRRRRPWRSGEYS